MKLLPKIFFTNFMLVVIAMIFRVACHDLVYFEFTKTVLFNGFLDLWVFITFLSIPVICIITIWWSDSILD